MPDNRKTKYDWDYLIELGYTAEELSEYEEGWADGILEALTDEYMASTYQDNIRYMLDFYEKDEVFMLMIRYTDAFMVNNDKFVSRLKQIEDKLGEDWSQVIWEQFLEDDESILDCVGNPCKSDWEEALEKLDANP